MHSSFLAVVWQLLNVEVLLAIGNLNAFFAQSFVDSHVQLMRDTSLVFWVFDPYQ